MTLKDDFAAKSPITFVYGADGRVCATQRRISSSAVPLYSALMGLNSPRLPKVISVREDDKGAVVTEGYIDGVTLRRALDNGRLGEDELRRLAIDICSALSLLHSSRPPIIHRDIKPENIICADGGGYVLIDFDASRLFKPEATSDTVTLGTNGYAAPEQYGFGQTGPYREKPAYDMVVQAMSGMMSVTGSASSGPCRVGVSIGDLGAGLYAVIGTQSALLRRARLRLIAHRAIAGNAAIQAARLRMQRQDKPQADQQQRAHGAAPRGDACSLA